MEQRVLKPILNHLSSLVGLERPSDFLLVFFYFLFFCPGSSAKSESVGQHSFLLFLVLVWWRLTRSSLCLGLTHSALSFSHKSSFSLIISLINSVMLILSFSSHLVSLNLLLSVSLSLPFLPPSLSHSHYLSFPLSVSFSYVPESSPDSIDQKAWQERLLKVDCR